VFFYGLLKFNAREELKQLRENARKSWHGRASLIKRFFGENILPRQCPAGHLLIPTQA
jgi:hypothetical protein